MTNILRYQENGTDRQNPTGNKSVQELAEEVLNGIWGNGEERKNALESAGYNYNKVQNAVNVLLSESAAGDLTEIAEAVIDGKYGNGQGIADIASFYGNGLDHRRAPASGSFWQEP